MPGRHEPDGATPGPPRRVGVIDIGSNSVLLLVLDSDRGVLHEEAHVTRIGAGVFDSGALDPAACERTRNVVGAISRMARALEVDTLVAVGTEALRRATDGRAFLDQLGRDLSLDAARVIDPEREAELTLEPSRREFPDEPLVVIDVGGGSTEVAWVRAGGSGDPEPAWVSLPLGSVRLTEAHLPSDPPTDAERLALTQGIGDTLAREGQALPAPAAGARVVAVAGTATTLAALELELDPYDGAQVEGLEVGSGNLRRWIERLSRLSTAERRRLAGMDPGRADVLVAGLEALAAVLERLGAVRFRVSERGVRHGVALRLLAGREPVW